MTHPLPDWMKDRRERVEWRCFHCDESFTDREAAAEHFGEFQDCRPACKIGVEQYRAMEAELQSWRSEDNNSAREFYGLGAKHAGELRAAEERGYARGLADARAESEFAFAIALAILSDDPAIALYEAWAWLSENKNLELTWGEIHEGDAAWRVHHVHGSASDREWELISTGDTPLEAVQAALASSRGEQK